MWNSKWTSFFLVFLFIVSIVTGVPMRGVGLAQKTCSDLKGLNVSWYYTWLARSPCGAPTFPPFVPMIQKESDMQYVATVNQTGATHLLGFNEPDEPNQANMDVATAIKLWPQLMDTGLILGSPSATQYPNSQKNGPLWLSQFMGNITQLGYRVDFICVHFYVHNKAPFNTIDSLKTFLENIQKSYPGYKVWLTEFNNSTGNVTENINYFEGVYNLITTQFNDLIERYSWFTNRWSESNNPQYFLNDATTGELTEVGKIYASKPNQ